MATISKILVAVDFSENSNRAVEAAIDLAGKFGAELEIVHAFTSPVPAMYPYDIGLPDTLMRDARNAAKEMLKAEADRVHAAGLTAPTHLTEIPAAGSISRVAEEIGADLLVIGTRGHSGLKHIIMGSVAERTIRESPCSVLVVK
jgi:universal stress protein A